MSKNLQRFAVILVLSLLLSYPQLALAASFELPPTIKANMDKMAAAADSRTSTAITKQYQELMNLQHQDREWDQKITDVHYSNEQQLIKLKQDLKNVDAAKITTLTTQVAQAKQKYQPILALYDSLKRQHQAAKALKDKQLTAALNTQVNTAKIAVDLVRQDIRMKEQALKNAKSSAAQTTKKLKNTLSEADTLKVQIKSTKSTNTNLKKKFTAETSSLKQAIKKGDAKASLKSLETLTSLSRQMIANKQKIVQIEQKITEVYSKVASQIPKK